MRLYVETMDTVVLEVEPGGNVRMEDTGWTTPTLQEKRAILHAARQELDALTELVETLDR